ncbi:MAG: LysR family transcriptional regulator, partial [Chloroflexota bacterium]
MNLEQLIVFDRIVREGSFSKAAWALQLAQPTVSARLKALEKSVGGELFKRNNRAVTLTERGSRFLPFARQALEAIQKGVDAAEQSPEIHSGILRAGVLRSMTGALVSTALQKLLGRYPSLDCQIQEGNHWQLVEWLHDNKIELGLVAWPSITPELSEMTSLLQFREPMVLLAHKNHPLAKKKDVTVADVEKMSAPFLLLKWWQVTPDIVSRLTERASHAIEVPTDTGRYLISKGI